MFKINSFRGMSTFLFFYKFMILTENYLGGIGELSKI
jgi:hypothetical protein